MAFIYNYYEQFIESEVALSLQAGEAVGSSCLLIVLDLTLPHGAPAATEYKVRANKVEVNSKYYAALLNLETRLLRLNITSKLSDMVLTQLLIDEVFPIVSFFDGALQLHASAVCREEEVTCFSGHSGAGKSSLAVSMLSRGYTLIDDDRVLLRLENREVKVFGNRHPLRLIRGRESCFNLADWQNLGMTEDGKLRLMPTPSQIRTSAICKSLVLLRVGESFQLSRSRLTQNFLALLECIPLSWFFSEYYGENFMRLLERLFGNLLFFSLVRRAESDPRLIANKLEALLGNTGAKALMLEGSEGFV